MMARKHCGREAEREEEREGRRRDGGYGSVLSLTCVMLDLNQDKMPDFYGVPRAESSSADSKLIPALK